MTDANLGEKSVTVRQFVQHNTYYVMPAVTLHVLVLHYQSHILHAALMLCAGGNNINASRVDIGMSENVRQLSNIFFNTVKGSGEQMPQVVRKDFLR